MHLQFGRDGSGFNVRAAGVAVRERRLLLHYKPNEACWTLPGGRVEFGETTQETVEREMLEELGAPAEVRRLLWVVEDFFSVPDGRRWHQLGWYYEIALPDGCDAVRRESWTALDGTVEANYRWVPLDELTSLPVSPAFLRTDAANLPSEPRRVVNVEGPQGGSP